MPPSLPVALFLWPWPIVLLIAAFVDIVPVPQLVVQSPLKSILNVMFEATVWVLVTVADQRVSPTKAALVAIQLVPQPLIRPRTASPRAVAAPQSIAATAIHPNAFVLMRTLLLPPAGGRKFCGQKFTKPCPGK